MCNNTTQRGQEEESRHTVFVPKSHEDQTFLSIFCSSKNKEEREEGEEEKKEGNAWWQWWWWQPRCFREPRSTFNHLRSITSGEVMAGFSCRGRRSGLFALSFLCHAWPAYESLPVNVLPSFHHGPTTRFSSFVRCFYRAIAFKVYRG